MYRLLRLDQIYNQELSFVISDQKIVQLFHLCLPIYHIESHK